MSAAPRGIVTWTTAHVVRLLVLPFLLLFAATACSDGGSSPSFVEDGTVSRHGSLRVSLADDAVREGDSVRVNVNLVGGSAAFDASKVQWSVQPSRAGTVRGGYFVADWYGDVTLSASFSGATGSASGEVLPAPRNVRELNASFFAGTAGQALPDSVAVLVTGRDGVAVAGVDVAFAVTSGGGTVSPAVARTDAFGVARTKWTLGEATGRNELQAGIASVGTTRVEAEAYADLSTALVELLDGAEQEGVVAMPLSRPLQVRVTDALGNPIRGITVEWTVPGDASESGVFSGIPAVQTVKRTTTDPGGVAQVYWRLGILAGDQEGSAQILLSGAQGGASAAPGNKGNGKGGGKTDFSAKAKPGHLSNVDVSPDQASTEVSGEVVMEADATDKWGNTVEADYSWTVSDASVATVDGSGRVKGLKPGTVTVTASSGPASGSATATILSGPPASTQASGSGQTGTVGKVLASPLTLTVLDEHGAPVQGVSVAWSVVSGGGSVVATSATTDANGKSAAQWTLGTAVGEQQARATVAGSDLAAVGYTATAEAPAVASITVSPSTSDVSVGGTVTLQAVARDATGKTLSVNFDWSSSAPGVATVQNGVVTGVSGGQAQIRASAEGMTGAAVVTVGGGDSGSGGGGGGETEPSVTLVQITPGQYTFTALGATTTLAAAALDGSGDPVPGTTFTWKSTNQGVASVDASGKVSAKAVGITSIIACVSACAVADTVTVTVEQVAAAVEVTPASVSLDVGDTYQLGAVVKDAGGYAIGNAAVTWSSSNPAVASVSPGGLVSALAEGNVVFRAQSGALWDDASGAVAGDDGGFPSGTGSPFFIEDFESGDMSNTMNGWAWTDQSRVRVSNSLARSGSYSLRFVYPGVGAGSDGMAEQRFKIGRNLSEYWLEYWIYLPDGNETWSEGDFSAKFTMRSGENPANNKWFRVWDGEYGHDNKHGFSIWPSGTRETSARAGFETSKASGSMGYLTGNPGVDPLVHETNGPIRHGQWTRMRIHVAFASTNTSDRSIADGVIEMWVGDRLVMSEYNQPLHGNISSLGHNNWVSEGYFMGWANTGFDEQTYVFIDDIRWYDQDPGW